MIDIIERQGKQKLKVSLIEARKCDFLREIEQPPIVYHMTERENLESIMESGKIKSFNDFLTYFLTDAEKAPLYIELTGAMTGRQYYNTDGIRKTAPPLIVADMVVLKLIPKRKEKLEWFRENIKGTRSEYETILWHAFNECSVCHYGDFQFDKEQVEIIELTDIYNNLSEEMAKTIKGLKIYKNMLKQWKAKA
jgi:hypothetical protein